MKQKFPQATTLAALTTLVMAGFLASCSGGGSSTAISGSVIDGYIQGATVCLDVNSNDTCDANEMQASTDASGAFTFNSQGVSTAGRNLIVEIPSTAKDSDDEGKTLAEAGKSAYTMATAADQPSVITPLTTMVVGKVKTEGLSFDQAKAKFLEESGLPSDSNLHVDHIKNGNSSIQTLARQLAAQLQEAQKNLPTGTASDKKFAGIANLLKSNTAAVGTLAHSSGVNLLNVPATITQQAATSQLMLYKMQSTKKGEIITASSMVFTPKTAAPAGGWPMVVFGHGTLGIDTSCAPSNILQAGFLTGYESLYAGLLQYGYVVVIPDYEGRGPSLLPAGVSPIPNAHPYLNTNSAGNSMALAAVATKQLLGTQVSGVWAMLGHSQGGHAALAAAQFSGLAKKINPSMDYRGAIAVAPASHFLETLDTLSSQVNSANDAATISAAYIALGNLNGFSSYMVKGSEHMIDLINAATVFGDDLKKIHTASVSKCTTPFFTDIQSDITRHAATAGALPSTYKGVITAQMKTNQVKRALNSLEPALVKVPGNTLIIQGSADATVLPAMTDLLNTRMIKTGSTVKLQTFTDANATHSGVLALTGAQTAIFTHLATVFTAK